MAATSLAHAAMSPARRLRTRIGLATRGFETATIPNVLFMDFHDPKLEGPSAIRHSALVSKPRSRHSTTHTSDNPNPSRKSRVPAQAGTRNVIDLASRRQAPAVIDGRQALVLAMVEQLSALVRGTTTAVQAGAVRRAASHALDVLERVDAGEADAEQAQRAFRAVEAVLARSHH